MYTALYRKWRPLRFSDVISQEHITRTLRNEIKDQKIAHAYLFCGIRGTGKTSTARIFARTINCENLIDGEPCNECRNCTDSLHEKNLDIVEIDAASNTGVENIRELIENVKYLPSQSKYRVYIIDEVHMLSISAFNALLKTLEEPPEHAVFILATTDVQKVPPTILSRCQRFDFKRISSDAMSQYIMKILDSDGIMAEMEAVKSVCRISDGAMRDALSILDQCISYSGLGSKITEEDVEKVLGIAGDDYLFRLTDKIVGGEANEALAIMNELVQNGKDVTAFLNDFLGHLRNLMVMKASGSLKQAQEIIEASEEKLKKLNEAAQKIELNKILFYIKSLTASLQEMKWLTHKKLYAEMALIKLTQMEFDESKEALIERINSLEQKINSLNIDNLNKMSYTVNEGSNGNTFGEAHGNFQSKSGEQRQNEMRKSQPQHQEPPKRIAITDSIDYCIKNWKSILEKMKQLSVIPLSTWVVIDEAALTAKDNMLVLHTDVVSELSIKREMNKIIDFLNTNYGVKVNIMVVADKQESNSNAPDDIEYFVEKAKKNFGNVNIEIKDE